MKQKLIPQFIMYLGLVFLILSISGILRNHAPLQKIFLLSGFFIVGCSGILIIARKSYFLGFMELKGIYGILYGIMITLTTWVLFLIFLLKK